MRVLILFLGIIMISSTISISSSEAFLPANLPDQSKAPDHVRVIEGENLIAYARPLYTSVDNPVDHEVPTSDSHDGVAKLILDRTDFTVGCSGTLASDGLHIITAAHCVTDDNGIYILESGIGSSATFEGTFEGNFQSIKITIDPNPSKSKAHPDYDGDFIKGNDIAVLELLEPAPIQIPRIPHANAASVSAVDDTVDKNGYGHSGFFSSGADSSTYPFGTEREGQNKYDAFADIMYIELELTAVDDFVPEAIYQYDSDDGNSPHDAFGFFFDIDDTGLGNAEVISAPGDSGGPTILNGELVGVVSYGITLEFTRGPFPRTSDCTLDGIGPHGGSAILDSSCGEFAGDTRVASYSSFIDSVLNSESNNSPIADANGPYSGDEDSSITFDSTGSSDPDNDPLTYSWDFGDDSTGTGATPSHVYSWGDIFTVTLTVSDGKGGSDTATTTSTIEEVNDPPTSDAGGPYVGTINEAITFDGTNSFDPDNQDGTISNNQSLTYSWDFDDGSTGSGVSPSHTYSAIGEFTVELIVSDGQVSDTSTATVIVNDISTEVSVTAITENSVVKGQSVNVKISGNGFVSGASVTLSNGSGPTPSVSNVVVFDDNTITATITAKSGGPPRDTLWNVTVTNVDLSTDTLINAFTVTRN